MALTPEQVLNKHFQTTQFRRGYEERDVDDFLDEIVAEMRSLIEQRDDYLKQLNDCRASKNQPAMRAGEAAGAAGVPAAARAGDEARVAGLSAKIQDAERAYKSAAERAAKAAVDSKALNEAQAKLNDLNSKVAAAEAKLSSSQQEAKAAEERAAKAKADAERAA